MVIDLDILILSHQYLYVQKNVRIATLFSPRVNGANKIPNFLEVGCAYSRSASACASPKFGDGVLWELMCTQLLCNYCMYDTAGALSLSLNHR
jgi:hypothetical protein